MKNKKGFTLVELLITIAIMVSILVISLVSYSTVSKRKKQEAYNAVKEQVLDAANSYFYANEYLFEGFTDESTGEITLGKLVSDDYIGKVTDPRTGKSISMCTEITVTKNGNSFKLELNEKTIDSEETTCDGSNNSVVITEPGGPGIKAKLVGGKQGKNDWYIENPSVVVEAEEKGNGPIKEIEKAIDGVFETWIIGSKGTDSDSYKNDTPGKKVGYKAINQAGKTAITYVDAKVDSTAPKVSASSETSSWVNRNVVSSFEASDNLGLDYMQSYWNKDGKNEAEANSNDYKWNGSSYNNQGGTSRYELNGEKSKKESSTFSSEGVRKFTIQACDLAGNCVYSNEGIIRIDKSKPTCGLSVSGTKGNNVGGVQWYKSNITVNLNKNDNLSGVSNFGLDKVANSTNGKASYSQSDTAATKFYGYVKDVAGNTNSCNSSIGVETKIDFRLDTAMTNNATSTTHPGKRVFTGSGAAAGYGYGYGNCTNCNSDGGSRTYFAIACENVGDYPRYFLVSAPSIANGTEQRAHFMNDTSSATWLQRKDYLMFKHSPNTWNKPYTWNSLNNNGGRVNFTKHNFWAKTPAGNTSQIMVLFTEYSRDCGY